MTGWGFAAAMLAFPGVAWIALRRAGVDREGAHRRAALSTFLATLWAIPGFLLWGSHGCLEGTPGVLHYLLPLGSMIAVLAYARRRTFVVPVMILLGAAFFGLLGAWTRVVHQDAWTGNPSMEWHRNGLTVTRWSVSFRPEDPGTMEREYPPGWLDEAPFFREDPAAAALLGPPGEVLACLPAWRPHTPVSGLWAMPWTKVRYWYPGGRLAEAIHRIEARPVEGD